MVILGESFKLSKDSIVRAASKVKLSIAGRDKPASYWQVPLPKVAVKHIVDVLLSRIGRCRVFWNGKNVVPLCLIAYAKRVVNFVSELGRKGSDLVDSIRDHFH